jgi:hypothetical protein
MGFMLVDHRCRARRLALLAAWIDYPQHGRMCLIPGGAWGEVFRKLSRKLRLDARTIWRRSSPACARSAEAMDAVPDGPRGALTRAASGGVEPIALPASIWGFRLPRDRRGDHRATRARTGLRRVPAQPRCGGQSPFILQSPAARSRVYCACRGRPAGRTQHPAGQPRCHRRSGASRRCAAPSSPTSRTNCARR